MKKKKEKNTGTKLAASLLVWGCFIPAAILNGGLREQLWNRLWGEAWGLPLSGIILSLFIFLLTWKFLPRVGRFSLKESYLVASVWVGLTMAFEFIFGSLNAVTGKELLAAYNPATGNLWGLVVLTTGISPILVGKQLNPWRRKEVDD